jgi:hypothetical protein
VPGEGTMLGRPAPTKKSPAIGEYLRGGWIGIAVRMRHCSRDHHVTAH